MNTKLFFVSILLVLFSPGCDENSTNGSLSTTSYIIPLALNNSWTYKMEMYDSLGNIDTIQTFTLVVIRDTTINSEKWYSFSPQTVGYTNRSDGYYSYSEQPILEYKYPAIAGDSIVVTQYLTRRVLSTNKSISVNGNNYTTYEYFDSYNTTSTQWTTYIVPNVGQVRIETTRLNSKSQRYLRSRMEFTPFFGQRVKPI